MVHARQTRSPCNLFHRGAAATTEGYCRISSGHRPRAQYLSPLVPIDPLGTKGAGRARALSLERLQVDLPRLQHGRKRASVRALSWRPVQACFDRTLLQRPARFTAVSDGRVLFSPLVGDLPKVRGTIPCAQPFRQRKACPERVQCNEYYRPSPFSEVASACPAQCWAASSRPVFRAPIARKRSRRSPPGYEKFARRATSGRRGRAATTRTGESGSRLNPEERGIH